DNDGRVLHALGAFGQDVHAGVGELDELLQVDADAVRDGDVAVLPRLAERVLADVQDVGEVGVGQAEGVRRGEQPPGGDLVGLVGGRGGRVALHGVALLGWVGACWTPPPTTRSGAWWAGGPVRGRSGCQAHSPAMRRAWRGLSSFGVSFLSRSLPRCLSIWACALRFQASRSVLVVWSFGP